MFLVREEEKSNFVSSIFDANAIVIIAIKPVASSTYACGESFMFLDTGLVFESRDFLKFIHQCVISLTDYIRLFISG